MVSKNVKIDLPYLRVTKDNNVFYNYKKVPKITFIHQDDNVKEKKITVDAAIGMSVLEVARKHKIDIEASCEGGLACSTCHVVVKDKEKFDSLEEASEEEEDLIDYAFNPTPTSRLCCQIIVDEKLEGIELIIPKGTRNIISE